MINVLTYYNWKFVVKNTGKMGKTLEKWGILSAEKVGTLAMEGKCIVNANADAMCERTLQDKLGQISRYKYQIFEYEVNIRHSYFKSFDVL